MREIKFRAWHKADARMYAGWSINGSNDGSYDGGYFGDLEFPDTKAGLLGEVGRDGWNHCAPDDVELMQFTGLTDKNGVEIYEGDIVDTCLDDILASPPTRTVVEWLPIGYYKHFLGYPQGEVIGNIHENPELLEAI